jgi:isoleucyl-tRNA synthetase
VRELRLASDAAAFVELQIKPNFKVLGARLGGRVKLLAKALAEADTGAVKRAVDAGGWDVTLDGETFTLGAAELDVRVSAKGEYEAASTATAVVVLHTHLDDDLRDEGFVRELTSRVQAVRKEEDLGYTERIALRFETDAAATSAIQRFGEPLGADTLCVDVAFGAPEGEGWSARTWEDVDGHDVACWLKRLG